MHHSRQSGRAVSAEVRAYAHEDNSSSIIDDSTASTSFTATSEVSLPTEQPVYESSWRRTGRSSMAADVRIPSFLIPCSASQLMDARYKSRKFSSAIAANVKTVSPAA